VVAQAGQYQQSLPQGRTYQLLRLRLDKGLELVPEITGHRLMVSVRLMTPDTEGRLKPHHGDVAFDLALCA
jgi:cell division protein ZapD